MNSGKKQPLVSIITPFLNVENFIKEAIHSVLEQTYKNWELILIDDGSTDGSSQIARDYADKYENIRYLHHEHHENKGASISRNLGLKYAKGEYIAFLDSDDIWLPGKLAHQIELMNSHPEADMICGASLYWHSWDDEEKEDELVYVGCEQNKLYPPTALSTLIYPLGRGIAPSMNGILIKRNVMEHSHWFAADFPGLYDDQVFLSKVYLRSSVYVTDECYDKYRQRPESLCGTVQRDGSYHTHRFYFLKWMKTYLKENNIQHKKVTKALNQRLQKYQWPRYHKAIEKKNLFLLKVRIRLKMILNMQTSSQNIHPSS